MAGAILPSRQCVCPAARRRRGGDQAVASARVAWCSGIRI